MVNVTMNLGLMNTVTYGKMDMNFIGSNCNFNNIVKDNIDVDIDYTIISYVSSTEDYSNSYTNKTIIILPIDTEDAYFDSTKIAYNRIINSAFSSLDICTSVFVYMPDYVNPIQVADAINNFDKDNLVDNFWIYPKIDNLVLRDNTVANLPWQKAIK
jgi:hypothetical protein